MAGPILLSTLVLLVTFGAFAHGDDYTDQPNFPRLLNSTNPNQRKIHIVSERLDSDGGYTQAEELIDLDLAKAVYIETNKGIRTTWLIDIRENTIHKYKPFTCIKQSLIGLPTDSQYMVRYGSPRIEVDERNDMLLFGISGLLESIRRDNTKTYSRTANHLGTVGDLGATEQIGHEWRLVSNFNEYKVYFTELAATAEGQTRKLVLNSIETIKKDGKTTIVNVLSFGHELPPTAYHNELQLPLIYGCTRDPKLSAEMQAKFDIIAADKSGPYHIRAKLRAMSFVGGNPTPTEPSSLDFALSRSIEAGVSMPPMRVHMVHQGDAKTVVDHQLQIKYETNLNDGSCLISHDGLLLSPVDDNPISLQFPDELSLNLTLGKLSSMLHGVTKENFMKLEHHGSHQFAYFADTIPDLCGADKIGRVVRKFSFDVNGRFKLDSLAVWILEWHLTHLRMRMREAYDFDIVESNSLAGDANSARAFDISRECYLNNPEMQQGRDYAWFELDYWVPGERVETLWSKVDELKAVIYQSIRKNLRLDYLRIPKMEIIFVNSGFILKMLVLDSLLPHLTYSKTESLALKEHIVAGKERVSSLRECSEFCLKHKCAGMSFNRVSFECSVTKVPVHSNIGDYCAMDASTDTYKMTRNNQASLPTDELRLERLIAAVQANSSHSVDSQSRMLGFDEFSKLNGTGNSMGFNNLRILFKLNGRVVELLPSGSRVTSPTEATSTTTTESEQRGF